MIKLYLVLACFMGLAFLLLALPFKLTNKPVLSKEYTVLVSFTALFVCMIYAFTGNYAGLSQWYAHDKVHYQLQTQIQSLGGINGIIAKIQAKLAADPNDAQGWFILGKLYFSLNNKPEALKALTKAHHLAPNDEAITEFYSTLS